ncbi:MAG: FGGY-family carbohydrate kinase, partial [Chitinophagales bacterium]|nr:FGGY-family carbohydrate kinase [Chitinophagales bacterium]
LGTSGPKVSVFDHEARLIDSAFHPVETIFTQDGGVEQNPREWIDAIFKAYSTIVQRGKFETSQIETFNISSHWSGTVPIDASGNTLMNGIIWMDSRGAHWAGQLTQGWPSIDGYNIFKILKWIRITGGGPTKSGKDSIAHILFIKNRLPHIYEKTTYFLEPKDYLNYYFCGRIAASYDSITLHWVTDNRDINNIKYHDGLLRECGIDKARLPELVPANSLLGEIKADIAEKMRLPKKVKVISGAPDTHAAAVGSGAVKDFEGHIYVGTSGWLLTHVPFKKTDLFHNMATFPSSIPGRYLLMNEQETAGACLNFIRDKICFPKDNISQFAAPENFYRLADELVSQVPAGSNGVMFTPWLNGERSPVDDHKLRATFINLSLNTTRADMIRAVYEGVANNMRWLMYHVEKLTSKRFDALRFIGGGANSDEWCQIMADTLDREIWQIADPISANARGAALLALAATGKISLNEVGSKVQVKKVFYPDKKLRTLYDERFELFKQIYLKQKKLFTRLEP